MLWWFIFASWASLSLFCLSGSHAALFALAPRLKPPDHRVLPALDDGAAVCASSAKHPTPSSQDCLILGLDLGLLCFFAGLPASLPRTGRSTGLLGPFLYFSAPLLHAQKRQRPGGPNRPRTTAQRARRGHQNLDPELAGGAFCCPFPVASRPRLASHPSLVVSSSTARLSFSLLLSRC